MAKHGRLTLDELGHTMPVEATPYPAPPVYYRDAEAIQVVFETEPDAVADVLPAPLTLVEPATAVLGFLDYRWSTLGPYREAMLLVAAELEGRPAAYVHQIACDSEVALLAGREIWGCPKRLARFDYAFENGVVRGRMEREGIRIASAEFRPERAARIQTQPAASVLTLRIVPSLEHDAKGPRAELLETTPERTLHHAWEGSGSLELGAPGVFNPWSLLPVKRVIGASQEVFDQRLDWPRVVGRL